MRFPTKWYVRLANAQTSLRCAMDWFGSVIVPFPGHIHLRFMRGSREVGQGILSPLLEKSQKYWVS